MTKILYVLLLITGFLPAWILCHLNQYWKFLPNRGIFISYFDLSIWCGIAIWGLSLVGNIWLIEKICHLV